MPQLTFPIVADDLRVDVRVNPHAPAVLARQAAQQPAPAPVVTRAVLDTGSNVSGVSTALVQQLSLVSYARSSTQGISGPVPVNIFRVSLNIFDPTQTLPLGFVQPDLWVIELTSSVACDVLIGMDVLLTCRMLLGGPGRQFTLDY